MSRLIAIVDTGPIVLLLETVDPPNEPDRPRRRAVNEQMLFDYGKRATLTVPTPVIAELGRDGSGLEVVREQMARRLARVRTEPLSARAADIAGEMRRHILSDRDPTRERGAITYDALIAAIAHVVDARWLLTTNGSHMRSCLEAVQSRVEVIVTDSVPRGTQLPLVARRVSTPDTP